ncbi:Importin subunit alpha-4 [Tulasnella sp. 408]|nr:Importin subunit alpha-4 [Tulasnella sp. 408]
MAEETLQDVTAGLAGLTLQKVSEIEASLTAAGTIKHLLPCLARYVLETPVNEANMESIEYAVQSLDRIGDRHLQRADFIATGVVPRLVKLLADSSSSTTLQKQALRCLGYVVSGTDDDTDVAIEAGLLPALLVPLETKNQYLCQLTLWNASNVAAGNKSQVSALLDSGLLKPVIRVLMDDQDSTICRREACWTVSNLTRKLSGDTKVAQAFLEGRCVEALSAALLIPDRQVKELAVSGITNILEWKPPQELEAGGSPIALLRSASAPQNLRAVRDARDVHDKKIKRDCHNLLTRYFPDCSRRARV